MGGTGVVENSNNQRVGVLYRAVDTPDRPHLCLSRAFLACSPWLASSWTESDDVRFANSTGTQPYTGYQDQLQSQLLSIKI